MIRGIIFDYGGTLDTNSLHWSEVLWEGFTHMGVPVSKAQFREAYVYAERALARHPHIQPEHNFLDLLRIKVDLETQHLVSEGHLQADEAARRQMTEAVAQYCYAYVLRVLEVSRPVVERLARLFPLVLVSNFYGNIHTILKDFRLEYFREVVESAVVGVRKPDPQIFRLGVEALGLPPEEVVVVGDSFSKDIVPARSIGCQTVWMRGLGWGDEETDETLSTWTLGDIAELPALLESPSPQEEGASPRVP